MIAAEKRSIYMPTLQHLLHGLVDEGPVPDRVPNVVVTGMAVDHREVSAGDLFVARNGASHHGLDFLADVIPNRPAAVLWEPTNRYNDIDGLFKAAGLPHVCVPNLTANLSEIAGRFYGVPSAKLALVGITGTDGKSSTAQFVAQALQGGHNPIGHIGTLGYGVFGSLVKASHTTPDSLMVQRLLSDMLAVGVRSAVMEVSSHALVQHRVAALEFDTAVLTNISRDHLDFHGSEVAYEQAKAQLFAMPGLKNAIINIDDAAGKRLANSSALSAENIFTYGFSEFAQIRGGDLQVTADGLAMNVSTPQGKGFVSTRLYGEFNAYNVLATLSVLLAHGFALQDALQRMNHLRPVPGRMEAFGRGSHPLVLVDYAHTPNALATALKAAKAYGSGKLICVFGCGGERDKGKRPLMGRVAEEHADWVVLTDDNPRGEDPAEIVEQIISGFTSRDCVEVQLDRGAAIEMAIDMADPEDVVLIAGKGHEDYQQVGLKRLPFDDRAEVQRVLGGDLFC